MAELLLRIVDKQGLHRANAIISTAGDVITVQRDDWPWGRMEFSNPEWRIWRLAGVDPEHLTELVDVDETRIAGGSYFVRARVNYIDISGAFARALIARSESFLALTPDETRDVLQLKRRKKTQGVIG